MKESIKNEREEKVVEDMKGEGGEAIQKCEIFILLFWVNWRGARSTRGSEWH